MADINRIGSPMDICDEGFDGAPGAVEKRKRHLEDKRQTKSPFLIGTIEDVNRKIGKLEQRLQSYTQLVVESRASDHPDAEELHPTSARGRIRYHEREKENRDVCKFAGIYTLKSTFLPNLSTRVKNISKISMQAPKERQPVKKDKDPSKPKFVELHQFPGYDPAELTPLPGHDATEILQIVVDASVNLDKKPKYQPEFQRLFFSPMSQAILQDIFWYVFLDNFQPNPTAQQKLFNRTAHNYVKVIFYAKNPLFRDTFLKDYPRLIAQAVHASFCHCFPDSYRQFGEIFKNELTYLVYGWIVGIKPSPRSWLEWNLTKLEPANIKIKEDILNKSKKKAAGSMSFNFDYLDSLVSSHPSQYPSSLSLNQSASKSSIGSVRMQRRNTRYSKKVTQRPIVQPSTHRSLSPSDKHDTAENGASDYPSEVSSTSVNVESSHSVCASKENVLIRSLANHSRPVTKLKSVRIKEQRKKKSIQQKSKKQTENANTTENREILHCKSVKITSEDKTQAPRRTHSPSLSQDSNLIDVVANAQGSLLKSTARDALETHRSSQGKQTLRDTDTQRSSNPKHSKDREAAVEALSPIRELTTEEETSQEKKMSQYSMSVMRDSMKEGADNEMMSHPACKGPDFVKSAFNLNGRSPLVAHFLHMRNLTADTNVVVRILHTEIDNLPPLDAPTYQDVIKESSRTVRNIERRFQEMFVTSQKETIAFLNQKHSVMREHRRREKALLANKPEVKRLSDLIVLEQRKGMDSISAGASQAVEAALMSQDIS